MGDTLTEIEAYAQDIATFSQAVTSGFQAVSTTFPALLAIQALLWQVQTSMQTAGCEQAAKRLTFRDLARRTDQHS
jgi:hypothetical protein